MTIAFAAKRPTFAVLIADRLVSIDSADGTYARSVDCCKIAFCQDPPLACTSEGRGMAFIPPDSEAMKDRREKARLGPANCVPLTWYMEEVLAQTDQTGLDGERVAERMCQRFGRLVEEYSPGAEIHSHLALANSGKVDVKYFKIQRGYLVECADGLHRRTRPSEVAEYFDSMYPNLFDERLADPAELASAMAELVKEAIKREGHKSIGFGIDTVVVSSGGVKCWHYFLEEN
jgi:hypothetical protein